MNRASTAVDACSCFSVTRDDARATIHQNALAEVKKRQSLKIGNVRDALINAGFTTLDQQAKALGLCRSTAWTIVRANHKASGLSANIINRMLSAPKLPRLVRARILEYVEEKAAGLYGHSALQARRFLGRIQRAAGSDN